MRRTLDIFGSLLALVLLSPVFGTIALLVRIADGKPVFFRQTRVGRHGKPFLILKFRTMRAQSPGSAITSAGDPRVTRVGRWLRRSKLDELPQFVNVLRGEMSLIGPRPEVPDYVQFDDPVWRSVLAAPPGITDLASLAFRDEEQLLAPEPDAEFYYRSVILPAKLRLNLRYLHSRSFTSDLQLLWMTALYSLLPGTFNRRRVLATLRGRA
jgi:lipopolysaccharide/colanic/teichoic acid biosynthesis glycosyltransferase